MSTKSITGPRSPPQEARLTECSVFGTGNTFFIAADRFCARLLRHLLHVRPRKDPIYVQGTQSLVRSWTADPTCRRTDGGTTSSQSNSAWLAQSIVNQAGGTFSYPSTNVQAWLCAPPLGSGYTNESAPQGALYYAQVASGTSPFFDVFAVTGCQGPEGVAQGNVSSANGNVLYPGEAALTAIGDDMSNNQKSETLFCTQNPGH